ARRGSSNLDSDDSVPADGHPDLVVRAAAAQMAAGRRRLTDKAAITPADVARTDKAEGLSYLDSLPRRLVTLYLPPRIILFVLLFPFYWMGLTAVKPDEQLIDMDRFNPFWTTAPTLKHINKLLFESAYPRWLWNTTYVAVAATVLSMVASVLAAYAIVR